MLRLAFLEQTALFWLDFVAKIGVVLCALPLMLVFFKAFQCNYFDDPGDTTVQIGNLVLIKPSNFTPSWIEEPNVTCYTAQHMPFVLIALAVRS